LKDEKEKISLNVEESPTVGWEGPGGSKEGMGQFRLKR
jgi:hypothetical protein